MPRENFRFKPTTIISELHSVLRFRAVCAGRGLLCHSDYKSQNELQSNDRSVSTSTMRVKRAYRTICLKVAYVEQCPIIDGFITRDKIRYCGDFSFWPKGTTNRVESKSYFRYVFCIDMFRDAGADVHDFHFIPL